LLRRSQPAFSYAELGVLLETQLQLQLYAVTEAKWPNLDQTKTFSVIMSALHHA
jgi:hypothetical protein